MKKFLLVFTMLALVLSFAACGKDPVVNNAPTISGATEVSLTLGSSYNPLEGVTAADAEDGDLTGSIVVSGDAVDVNTEGVYNVVLTVTDDGGKSAELLVTVNVGVYLANYLSGIDLSKLNVEQKGILLAELENYLLDTVAGGVPLYRSAARVMFSERTQLFSETYNGVMAFGASFSQFTQDDSNVLMFGEVMGEVGEYTWRGSFNTDPTGLNPWEADDSSTSDFVELFTGGLYDFYFDASKTGYEINGSLADGEPMAVNGTDQNGKEYAYIWQIELKDNLTWTYHPDTDVSGLPAGHEVLDANDYLWTWQHALDNSWFRAISGGGDFITHGVKGISDYLAGSVTFDEVGLRMADGETNVLEIEFTTEKTAFDIKYMFANSLTPINEELFMALGGEEGSYGLTPEEVASSGVYYFETWTPGQFLTFKKNDAHPDSAMFHYTGYQYRFVDGSDSIFAEFLAGRLDTAAVPASQVDSYGQDPRVKVSPGATTWRLQINGFGTEANRDAFIAQYPEFGLSETFVPEPILGYTEMKQALYYGFDRKTAAVDVVKTYLPAATHFAATYFLDGESGISVRGTEAGQATLDTYAGESFGYFPDAAVALFKAAVAQGIADGYYSAGTAEAPTEIELVLTYASSGNTGAQAMVAEIKQQYESLLVDDVNHVQVIVTINDVAFPDNYYNFMMIANTDLGIGGISGSLLDAPSFLDVYNDNNKSGFTLNWGIDTHTPNIEVTYENLDGDTITEIWAYNALVEAINGKVYIMDGIEQSAWEDSATLINAYLDMAGEEFASSSDGSTIAEYVLGDTLANLADEDDQIDSIEAYIVVTASGKNSLYVLNVKDGKYEMNTEAGLFTDLFTAIETHADYELISVGAQITDDAGVLADAYLAGLGITTYADLVAEAGAVPAEIVQAYAVTWGGTYGGTDVYLVLFVDGYYIGWAWL